MNYNKQVLVKALRLEKCFTMYRSNNKEHKQEVKDKFVRTWGEDMAGHFLWKYDNAESLIYALDSENLALYIEKF